MTAIYLDNNSTTPCAPEVIADMSPYFAEAFGNPASPHSCGRTASSAVTRAREQIASTIGVEPAAVIFTSGATEANNLALFGLARRASDRRKIVVSAVEHKSVLVPADAVAEEGFLVEHLPVDGNGVVVLEAARRIIDAKTLAVSVQAANNETGVLQPVKEVAEIARSVGAMCHCDAAQAIGKIPVDVADLGVDLASFSAHKAYGPKGIGVLAVCTTRIRPWLKPVLVGGGQEGNLRAGTLNVPGIVGFGTACRLASMLLRDDTLRTSSLRRICEERLLQGIPSARINGRAAPRLSGTISLTIPGVPADILMANLQTVCIGDGAACHSGALEPSHVLLAMNLSRADAECTVRISLGRYTTEGDVIAAVDELISAAQRLLAGA
jgi:cysteine desulfurase